MRNQARSLWLGIAIFGLLVLPSLLGQDSRPSEAGIPTDWSHHHLIFSRPATAEQARRVQQDPRYGQQRDRSLLRTPPPVAEPRQAPSGFRFRSGGGSGPGHAPIQTHRDWSQDLGMGATVGAGNFPAKYSFATTNANCVSSGKPDFVVYSTGLAGSSGQASIVAYDNLYTGCSGTVPSVYWAYNTEGQILTSPAFSRDGKQVAFVETDADLGILVLLKWAPSGTETVSMPLTLNAVRNADYPSCVAPCMTTILLETIVGGMGVPTNDTTSSVFLDLSNDTAWVGDDIGLLHKFSPVFLGTPAEVTSGGFPVQVNPGNPTALSSPVHDFVSGNVFVGDMGGFLYAVNSTGVTQSGELDFGVGIVEGPVVDTTAELVYVFASDDGSGECPDGDDCTGVYQLLTGFLSGDTGSEVTVGTAGTSPNPAYIGAFDSTYENSTNATGNLYVCGNTGGQPTIYQVPITAPIAGPVLSTTGTTPPCSPVTDIYTANVSEGASEFIFASAEADGTSTACASGGCIFNFNDTPWQPLTEYSVGQEVVDTHFQIQVVFRAGISGSSPPSWTSAPGGTTVDSAVRWLDQGVTSATTPAAWQSGFLYKKGNKVLDSSNNIELVTAAPSGGGTSGGTIPSWSATPGGVATDNLLRWTNVGVIATTALPEAGGTSGIIIDNTVGSGTIIGGSQVYFSTLSDQPCGTSGTGGCAVQASQSALK